MDVNDRLVRKSKVNNAVLNTISGKIQRKRILENVHSNAFYTTPVSPVLKKGEQLQKPDEKNGMFYIRQTHLNTFRDSTKMRNPRLKARVVKGIAGCVALMLLGMLSYIPNNLSFLVLTTI